MQDDHNSPRTFQIVGHKPADGALDPEHTRIQADYCLDCATIASAVEGKGWSTLIDLAALTGRTGAKIVMKPIRVEDLNPANLNG